MGYRETKGTAGFLISAFENRYLALTCRLVIGGIFIFAGVGKLPYSYELFIGLPEIMEFLGIPQPLWKFIRLDWLPVIEIIVGSCLVAGLLTKPAALVTILLTAAFFVFNGLKMIVSTTEWCNCAGVLLEVPLPVSQVIDITMLLMALLLLFHRRVDWSLDMSSLKRLRRG